MNRPPLGRGSSEEDLNDWITWLLRLHRPMAAQLARSVGLQMDGRRRIEVEVRKGGPGKPDVVLDGALADGAPARLIIELKLNRTTGYASAEQRAGYPSFRTPPSAMLVLGPHGYDALHGVPPGAAFVSLEKLFRLWTHLAPDDTTKALLEAMWHHFRDHPGQGCEITQESLSRSELAEAFPDPSTRGAHHRPSRPTWVTRPLGNSNLSRVSASPRIDR